MKSKGSPERAEFFFQYTESYTSYKRYSPEYPRVTMKKRKYKRRNKNSYPDVASLLEKIVKDTTKGGIVEYVMRRSLNSPEGGDRTFSHSEGKTLSNRTIMINAREPSIKEAIIPPFTPLIKFVKPTA